MASTQRSGPIESRTMFLSAGIFMAILLAMMAFVSYARRQTERILRNGRPTRVTVLDKEKTRKGTTSVQVRLDEAPGREPFWRLYREDDFALLKAGDTLAYVYEPEFPEGGVLGTPDIGSHLSGYALVFAVFVLPFLVAGSILKVRERFRIRPTS
jgi:hypothetical protein